MKKTKRAARRAATRRIIDRRVREARHVAFCGDVRWIREPGRFKSDSFWCCNCRKRRHGNPRVSAGMCDIGVRDSVYSDRAASRELGVLARRGDFSEEALDLVLRRFDRPN